MDCAIIYSQSSPIYQHLKSHDLIDHHELVQINLIDDDDQQPQSPQPLPTTSKLSYVPMFLVAHHYNIKLLSLCCIIFILHLLIHQHYIVLGVMLMGWYHCYQLKSPLTHNLKQIIRQVQQHIGNHHYSPQQLTNIMVNVQAIVEGYLGELEVQHDMLGEGKVECIKRLIRLRKLIGNARTNKLQTLEHMGWLISKYKYTLFVNLEETTEQKLRKYLSFMEEQSTTQKHSIPTHPHLYYSLLVHELHLSLHRHDSLGMLALANIIELQLKYKHAQPTYLQSSSSQSEAIQYEEPPQHQPFYLNSDGQMMNYGDETIQEEVEMLRERLDDILRAKLQQQQQEQEKKEEPQSTKIKHERRVEGFGMMFQNLLPTRNDIQYLQ